MKPYGTLTLTVSSPAQIFDEPLTLVRTKEYLRVNQTAEDDLIEAMIVAARSVAEIERGEDIVVKQWDYALDAFLAPEIHLRHPLQSVDLVKYTDADGVEVTLTETTDYVVDLARAVLMPVPGGSWPSFDPWPSSAVLIRYTSGYPATDAFWADAGKMAVQGMLMLITLWYDERMPMSTSTSNIQELPYTVTALFGYGSRKAVF